MINSGIHAFHGLDSAWYFSRAFKTPSHFSQSVLNQFLQNATKLKDMMVADSACVIWKTMNDYGSYTHHYKKKKGTLSAKLKFQEVMGLRYRELSERVKGVFLDKVPIMDTRGLTSMNPSLDPYHHPNLQRQLASLAWHTIFLACQI